MPSLKTILNSFALEHNAFRKTFESVLRHGIRLNFSSDNPAFSKIKNPVEKVKKWNSKILLCKVDSGNSELGFVTNFVY